MRWEDQDDDDENIDEDSPVKALTSIENVARVTLAGASLLGTPGVARRQMEAPCSTGLNASPLPGPFGALSRRGG